MIKDILTPEQLKAIFERFKRHPVEDVFNLLKHEQAVREKLADVEDMAAAAMQSVSELIQERDELKQRLQQGIELFEDDDDCQNPEAEAYIWRRTSEELIA